MNKKKILIFTSILFILFMAWFYTREVQEELLYKLSGSNVLEVKEKCKILAEQKQLELSRVTYTTMVGSGYSEFRGYCYMEYLVDFDDWTAKILYNTTEDKVIITRKWPEEAGWYNRGFNWFVNGQKRYYQTTF